jgi:ERCC4-type nuclease
MAVALAESKTLILDNREHELHLKVSIPHDFVPLHVGDIHICARVDGAVKPVLILERKSFADFQSSVMDGRYREQRGRLLAYGAEVGAKVGYVLEGSAAALRPPMTASSIDKLVARLMYVHGIPVFRTLSVVDTARLAETLLGQVMEDGVTAFQGASVQRATEGIHVIKRGNTEDPRHFGISLLCLAHGVSTKVAEAWLNEFGTVAAVIAANSEQLAAVKVGARRVGPALANRCISVWTAASLRA